MGIISTYKLKDNIKKELLLEIAKIATETEIFISTIQRKLSVGFACATKHLEWLLDNQFAIKTENNTYIISNEQYNKLNQCDFI